MRTFAKIGTGPQEGIIQISPRRQFTLADVDATKTIWVKWKRPGRYQPVQEAIFCGFAGDGIMLSL